MALPYFITLGAGLTAFVPLLVIGAGIAFAVHSLNFAYEKLFRKNTEIKFTDGLFKNILLGGIIYAVVGTAAREILSAPQPDVATPSAENSDISPEIEQRGAVAGDEPPSGLFASLLQTSD